MGVCVCVCVGGADGRTCYDATASGGVLEHESIEVLLYDTDG